MRMEGPDGIENSDPHPSRAGVKGPLTLRRRQPAILTREGRPGSWSRHDGSRHHQRLEAHGPGRDARLCAGPAGPAAGARRRHARPGGDPAGNRPVPSASGGVAASAGRRPITGSAAFSAAPAAPGRADAGLRGSAAPCGPGRRSARTRRSVTPHRRLRASCPSVRARRRASVEFHSAHSRSTEQDCPPMKLSIRLRRARRGRAFRPFRPGACRTCRSRPRRRRRTRPTRRSFASRMAAPASHPQGQRAIPDGRDRRQARCPRPAGRSRP